MSFPKESVFPSVSGLPTSTKSEHMVCSDPACPTTSDPFTGRITCRCYQISELRDQAQNPQVYTTSGYPGLYPTSYPMETQPSATSPLQSNPGMNPYTTSMMSNAAYPPQFIPQGTTMPQLDNILRSQVYNYMYPGVMDLNGIARRKNATRETTSALKAWLQQHKKNPYPTKAEKIMLAIVTKMTLTQVSTWFANARRRLKKEHKGEWSSDNSFDNGSDNENDDHDSDDASKQNNSLNHPSFTERLPLLHSTPIPNRVPDLPKEHTSNTNINAQDRLPGFTSFAPLSSNSANQNNPQCSISPPLHPYSHSSMMSSVPQTFPPLPLSAAPVTQNHYALYNGMKYDNHMYAQTFPRTSHLDSEGDSNQNLSGSSFDESDKENTHISGSSHSSNSVSPLVTKSTKVPSNSADSKPRIWSISHIIGGPEKQPSVSSPDTVQCPVVTKDVTDTTDSQSLENIIVS